MNIVRRLSGSGLLAGILLLGLPGIDSDLFGPGRGETAPVQPPPSPPQTIAQLLEQIRQAEKHLRQALRLARQDSHVIRRDMRRLKRR